MRSLRRLFRTPLLSALALMMMLGMTLQSGRTLAQESMRTLRGDAAAPSNQRLGIRSQGLRAPSLAIEPYVRPDLHTRLAALRPQLRAAAARHNREQWSGMSDHEFAATLALILFNENNGWLEDDIEPLRAFTPLYQELQRQVNVSPMGGNFSVWPANLRPSVALEILQQHVPLSGTTVLTVPLKVEGSRVDLSAFSDQEQLFAAITSEISRDDLAISYLAANLERGIYRARAEGIEVNWRTLAAWHNQGIVDPAAIRTNPTAFDYVRRAAAYLGVARTFVVADLPPRYPPQIAE